MLQQFLPNNESQWELKPQLIFFCVLQKKVSLERHEGINYVIFENYTFNEETKP